MRKQFKKFVLATTVAFLLLTTTNNTTAISPLPSAAIGQEGNAVPTPLPEEENIQPLVDDDEDLEKTN